MAISSEVMQDLADLNAVVQSPAFQQTCDEFLNAHCQMFTVGGNAQDENKLEWTLAHQEYEKLVEANLTGALGEERIANLCAVLPALMKESEELAPYSESIMLLTNFTDYEMFKQAMISRNHDQTSGLSAFTGSTAAECLASAMANGAMGGELPPDVEALFGESARLYELARGDGWTEITSKDDFTMSSIKATDANGNATSYYKTSVLLGLGIEHQKHVWLDMGPVRDVYDNGLMYKNSQCVHEFAPGDIIFTATFTTIPKAMRWMFGLTDTQPWRIITRDTPDGGFIYAFMPWDMENNCVSKKLDLKETGMCMPHPEDPGQSFIISVSKASGWVPNWVMGKMTQMSIASLVTLFDSYKKNVLGA